MNGVGNGEKDMSKISLGEALKIVPVGKTKLYADAKEGVISTEKDHRGKLTVDVSELERVYGKLKNPETENERTELDINEQSKNGTKPSSQQSEIVQNLENQVSELENQLQQSEERERELKTRIAEERTEKSKLLDLANSLQKQNELLMLPNPNMKPKGSFLNYFRWKR